jgi:dTDP-4-dehydrorhamnose reductase
MKKVSVLILGGGLVGQMFTKVLNTGEFDLAVAKRKTDEWDLGQGYPVHHFNGLDFPPYVAKDFDYIVNTVGVVPSKIDESCTHSKLNALLINSVFPYQLARNCPKSKIINISTSYVFGLSGGGKTETDMVAPITTYEKTKVMGEVLAENVMNLRCSIIGPDKRGGGLLEWFKKERKTGKVEGFTNHTWNGLTSLQLAQIVRGIIKDELFTFGYQHVVPNSPVTKFQLISMLNNYPWGEKDVAAEIIEKKADYTLDRSLKTVRLMNNMLLWRSAGYAAPLNISGMIREMAIWCHSPTNKFAGL